MRTSAFLAVAALALCLTGCQQGPKSEADSPVKPDTNIMPAGGRPANTMPMRPGGPGGMPGMPMSPGAPPGGMQPPGGPR